MKRASVVDTELENAAIAAANLLETAFKGKLEADEGIAAAEFVFAFLRIVLAQEVFRHGGHDGAREQVGREHGEDDGFSEGDEEIFRHAAEEEHGHEDDADGDGGDESGNGDLRGAVENGLLDGLAGLQVAVDVFNLNGGVVDEDADRERETAEGHDVDGLAEGAEGEQRGENRERNGNGDDDRAAPAAEKDEDHDRGEACGDDGFVHDAVDGSANEDGLVGQRRDLEFGGSWGLRLSALAMMPFTILSVEALPVLMTESSAARWPSTRTMLVWGGSRCGRGQHRGCRPWRR
jgi:hypothetical protein